MVDVISYRYMYVLASEPSCSEIATAKSLWMCRAAADIHVNLIENVEANQVASLLQHLLHLYHALLQQSAVHATACNPLLLC